MWNGNEDFEPRTAGSKAWHPLLYQTDDSAFIRGVNTETNADYILSNRDFRCKYSMHRETLRAFIEPHLEIHKGLKTQS